MIKLLDKLGWTILETEDPGEATSIASGDPDVVRIVDTKKRWLFWQTYTGWIYEPAKLSAECCKRCSEFREHLGDGWYACKTCDKRDPVSYADAKRDIISRSAMLGL